MNIIKNPWFPVVPKLNFNNYMNYNNKQNKVFALTFSKFFQHF